ncbi:hypothetical protein LSM04_008307 [Trypanosoma melophagium]|uniref:uncharacterized protein n=1 Tax=Trypanosoma melophagium TaxID=715481 RepID=UPI003519FD19|nr:hypothetical protein LSM04_008307 [Trypanosoma melophagium]
MRNDGDDNSSKKSIVAQRVLLNRIDCLQHSPSKYFGKRTTPLDGSTSNWATPHCAWSSISVGVKYRLHCSINSSRRFAI